MACQMASHASAAFVVPASAAPFNQPSSSVSLSVALPCRALSSLSSTSPTLTSLSRQCARQSSRSMRSASAAAATPVRAMAGGDGSEPSGRIISGKCFVLEDNIDTDQIIPAEYLTLVPSNPDEYEKLGSYAMAGLPAKHTLRYVQKGQMKTEYAIIIGGANFGCGSSREHAPVALGAAGCRAVVAESYARIFFRNCVATGELYPVEAAEGLGGRLCEVIKSGDEVTVDLEHDLLIHHTTGKQYALKPIGEAGPVIDAGGIFNFARQSGMIAQKA